MAHCVFELFIAYQPTIHLIVTFWLMKKIMLRNKKTARRRLPYFSGIGIHLVTLKLE